MNLTSVILNLNNIPVDLLNILLDNRLHFQQGCVAQRITRLTTDQKIPGSNPGTLDAYFFEYEYIVYKAQTLG